jgi:hypothetical protein
MLLLLLPLLLLLLSQAANEAMVASCDVIGNRYIEHTTTNIFRFITNTGEAPETLHTLAGVTFVQSPQAPAWYRC